MTGWMNNFLKIDLSSNNIKQFTHDNEFQEKYIGGTGFGVKLVGDNQQKGIDPFSPENTIVISTGPLTGTRAPMSGRCSMVTKSPLTNTIFDSNSGGHWGVKFKRCGFDGIWLSGKASDPIYLKISDDQAEVKSAEKIWGLNVAESTRALKQTEGKNCSILTIGPSGENLVKISAVMNDEHRAFGRGGLGSVWGSKNLKAIVTENGTKKPEIARPENFNNYVNSAFDKILQGPITGQALRTFGTSVLVNIINEFGLFPIRNNQAVQDVKADNISGESIRESIFVKPEACNNCPIACGRVTKTSNRSGKGPEYESVWALGAQCGIFNLESVTNANYECNLLGLDTISMGSTISCAMELHQHGLIDEHIEFGHADQLIPLIQKTSVRKGIGADLAEGSMRFARKYNSEQYAMQVKGLELPAYDPRGAMGHALAYATSNRGGCHLRGFMVGWEVLGSPKLLPRFNLSGKTDILVKIQNNSRVTDSLVTCKFQEYSVGFDHLVRLLSAATGINYTISSLQKIGERIWNLERIFNLREGFTKTNDTLPPRFLNEPVEKGPSSGHVVDIETLLEYYYNARGWDENGVPTLSKLDQLEINGLEASK
jgi:aldehyde:ferredoxin oxidoreductase